MSDVPNILILAADLFEDMELLYPLYRLREEDVDVGHVDAQQHPAGIARDDGGVATVRIDSLGCPLDSDADGVYDGSDQCPATAAGVGVDGRGVRREAFASAADACEAEVREALTRGAEAAAGLVCLGAGAGINGASAA